MLITPTPFPKLWPQNISSGITKCPLEQNHLQLRTTDLETSGPDGREAEKGWMAGLEREMWQTVFAENVYNISCPMCSSRPCQSPIKRQNQPGQTFETASTVSAQQVSCYATFPLYTSRSAKSTLLCRVVPLFISLWRCLSLEPSHILWPSGSTDHMESSTWRGTKVFPWSLADLPASSPHQLTRHLRGPSWIQILLWQLSLPSWHCVKQGWSFSAKSDPDCTVTGKINNYHCFNPLSLEWFATRQ